jgi:hypothetical protein
MMQRLAVMRYRSQWNELTEKLIGHKCFCSEQLRRVLTMLFCSGQDYNVNKRGDNVSWSRITAIQGYFRVMQAHLMLKNLDAENEIPIMIYFGLAHRAGTNSFSVKNVCQPNCSSKCIHRSMRYIVVRMASQIFSCILCELFTISLCKCDEKIMSSYHY